MKKTIFISLLLFTNFLIITCSSPNQVENEKLQSGQYYLSINENSTKVLEHDQNGLKININNQDLNRFKKVGSV